MNRAIDLLTTRGSALFALLYRLTQRHDAAADLLQELFLRLDASDGFRHAVDASAYAGRTAINLAIEWRRRQRHDVLAIAAQIDPSACGDDTPAIDTLANAERMTRLLNALTELGDLQRECFVLRHIERQSYETIAAALGKTPHQVRGHCHAAIRQLRLRCAEKTDDAICKERSHHAAS